MLLYEVAQTVHLFCDDALETCYIDVDICGAVMNIGLHLVYLLIEVLTSIPYGLIFYSRCCYRFSIVVDVIV